MKVKKETYTRVEVVELLVKYNEIVRMQLSMKVLETSSKIILPKPSKFIDKPE